MPEQKYFSKDLYEFIAAAHQSEKGYKVHHSAVRNILHLEMIQESCQSFQQMYASVGTRKAIHAC